MSHIAYLRKTAIRGQFCVAIALLSLTGGCSKSSAPVSNAHAGPPAAQAASTAGNLKTDEEKTLYSVGLVMGRNLGVFRLSPAELEIVKKGVTDSVNNAKPAVDLEVYGPKIQALAQARGQEVAKEQEAKAKPFLEKAAKEQGAQKKSSGLVFKSLKPGKGDKPSATSTVKVHYHGTLMDGTVFDSSVKRGQPAEFPLNQVIPCWTEGVQLMKIGEKAKLTCPAQIAYGAEGRPPTIPGGAPLVFEVELLEIVKK